MVAVLVLVLVLCFVGVGVVLIVLVGWLVGWLLCQIGNIQSWGDTEHPRDGTLHVLCSTPQQLNKGAKEQRNKGAKERKGKEANQEKTSLRRLNDGSPGYYRDAIIPMINKSFAGFLSAEKQSTSN